MDNHRFLVNFVAFAPQPISQFVHNSLHSLGYIVNRHTTEGWLNETTQAEYAPTILLLAQAVYPREGVLSRLQETGCSGNLIVIPAHESELHTEVLLNCNDFLTWPCHDSELKLRLTRVCPEATDRGYVDNQSKTVEFLADLNMVGHSPAFNKVFEHVKKISQYDASVLIEGETGTGKELAARAVHYLGQRRDCPFIPVNCGAIPDNLIENELFGHERGAFTDARNCQPGLIKIAEGGTLFLDEIDALSERAQVSLLRFLDTREYKPLGGSQIVRADVRIIVATNADITNLVDKGLFRQDLFFRLNILSLNLPPLRERIGDIPFLANYFSQQFAQQYNQPQKVFHEQTLCWIQRYHWPGNVRELENFVHRQFLITAGPLIITRENRELQKERRKGADRRQSQFLNTTFNEAKLKTVSLFEKSYIERLVQETKGNVTLAAKKAGKERRAFGKLLKKYAIQKSSHMHNE